MPLEVPNLDDRTFQQLLDEARRLIPQYSPAWTDHNLSDPGITLLELFATLVETMIYRLNRVPEKSYITFLNLMGIRLQPAAPAKVGLTFWLSEALSAADSKPFQIPAGFEVAIRQTGAEQRPVTFMTDTARTVYPLSPITVLPGTSLSKPSAEDRPYNYLGVAVDISGHIVTFTLDGQKAQANDWQAWCGDGRWQPVKPLDSKPIAGAQLPAGMAQLPAGMAQLPAGMAQREIKSTSASGATGGGADAYWLRLPEAQWAKPAGTVAAATLGITVSATHSKPIYNEVIGRSNGQPRQAFRLAYPPVLVGDPPAKDDVLEIQAPDGNWQPWMRVDDFGASQADDKHYTLDPASGEVAFGPRIREPDGRERQYGATPLQGSVIRFRRYRSGGGVEGNVGANTLTLGQLPGIRQIENREPAAGGRAPETIERAALRAPDVLRTGERAVTVEDFERLAIAAPGGGIGRAYCLAGDTTSNTVLLLLTPAVEQSEIAPIPSQELRLRESRRNIVKKDLEARRLLTTKLSIRQPRYLEIAVTADLQRHDATSREAVVKDAEQRLYQFLHPLTGGPDGIGWPFGRSLYKSEVYAKLQSVPGVDYVKSLSFASTEISMPESDNDPLLEINPKVGLKTDIDDIAWDMLVISGKHLITAA